MPALLAAADICLVPLRDVPLFATFIPSKMFEYLAAGKAVDRRGDRRGGADPARGRRGRGPAGGQRRAGRRRSRALAADPGRRAEMAAAGRAYVERFFDRAELARRVPQDPRRPGRPPMRLLVTGGSGFLGGYVLREAARARA